MKKLLALVLAAAMCLALTPMAAASSGPEEIGYGDLLDLPGVQMSIAETAVTPKLVFEYTSGNSRRTASVAAQEGMEVIYLTGGIVNKGTVDIVNRTFAATVSVNGEEYTAFLFLVDKDSAESFINLTPGQKSDYCLYANIPAEAAENITDFSLTFGLNDDLSDAFGRLEEADRQFVLHGLGQAETVPELSAAPAETPAPEIDCEAVAPGGVISLDFVELTVGEPTYAAEIREGNGGVTYTRPAQTDGNVIFWLPVTLVNTSGSGYKLSGWRTMVQLVFDGTYTYEGKMENLAGGNAKSMDPLVTNNIYVYGEIPQSLAESYESVVIRFGFNDGFEEYSPFDDTMADLDHIYECVIGEAPEGAEDSGYQQLAPGDTVELDFATLAIDGVSIQDEIYPEDTSGVYIYYEDKENAAYIFLKGTIKNLAGENLEGRYVQGKISINDFYNYDAGLIIASDPAALTDYALAPLQEAPFYLYASVPQEAVDLLEQGVITLSFNDMFAQESGGYAYNYQVPFTK